MEGRECVLKLHEILRDQGLEGEDWKEALWECVVTYQGQSLHTSGRYGRGGRPYYYMLKTSARTGKNTDEMIVNMRTSKTITRSTVELGFKNALQVQEEEGRVAGPKKLAVRGCSYLYPLFLELGVITRELGGTEQMQLPLDF